MRSLDELASLFQPVVADKFVDGNAGETGSRLTMLHYMAMFL